MVPSLRAIACVLSRLGSAGLLSVTAATALADTWVDAFDSPVAVWRLDDDRPDAELKLRERVRLAPLSGRRGGVPVGAEHLVYQCPPGRAAWFWRDAPAAAIIEELRVEADVRASVPGVLLAVEVALPRDIDKRTGKPHRVVVRQRPTKPAGVGDLQLVLDDLPRRLRARVRVMRVARDGSIGSTQTIDERGAYVTRIGIAAPGDPRPRDLWTKELRLENLVRPPRLPSDPAAEEPTLGPILASPRAEEAPPVGGRVEPTRVSVDSDGFRVDGKLFFPRVWRSRGEPLEFIVRRGFNTVWIERPPGPAIVEEAARRGLRLLSPPPTDADQLADVSLSSVLAWVLPGEATGRDVDTRLVDVERCRALPAAQRRPILVETRSPAVWCRLVDGLLIDAAPRLTAGGAPPVDRLIRAVSACRPGTPLIALVHADVTPATQAQLDALLDGAFVPGWLPPSTVADAVYRSVTAGCRGVAFVSTEPLDTPDDAALQAAAWLQETNSQLRLLQPWLVGTRSRGGSTVGPLVLERNSVRIALPRPFPPTNRRPMVLAGLGDGGQLHRVTAAGVAAASGTRVAGGLRIENAGAGVPGSILFGGDARVVNSLRRYTAEHGRQAAMDLVRFAGQALSDSDAIDPSAAERVKRLVTTANLALARRELGSAYDLAYSAIYEIESAARRRREIVAPPAGGATSNPLTVLPRTLTDHVSMMQLLAGARRGSNRLAGGSFEDIDQVRRLGWRNAVDPADAVTVELANGSPIHGARRLTIRGESSGVSESGVVSPPTDLTAGELFEITGWVRVASEGGGVLTIVDTLGGPELGLVIGATSDWTPFQLLRRAGNEAEVSVRFSVEGAATADIDGVMLRAIEPLTRRQATARRTAPPAGDQRK